MKMIPVTVGVLMVYLGLSAWISVGYLAFDQYPFFIDFNFTSQDDGVVFGGFLLALGTGLYLSSWGSDDHKSDSEGKAIAPEKRRRPEYTVQEVAVMEKELAILEAEYQRLIQSDIDTISVFKKENPRISSETYIRELIAFKVRNLKYEIDYKRINLENARKFVKYKKWFKFLMRN